MDPHSHFFWSLVPFCLKILNLHSFNLSPKKWLVQKSYHWYKNQYFSKQERRLGPQLATSTVVFFFLGGGLPPQDQPPIKKNGLAKTNQPIIYYYFLHFFFRFGFFRPPQYQSPNYYFGFIFWGFWGPKTNQPKIRHPPGGGNEPAKQAITATCSGNLFLINQCKMSLRNA